VLIDEAKLIVHRHWQKRAKTEDSQDRR